MRIFSDEIHRPAVSSEKLRELISPMLPDDVEWPMVSVKAPWIVIRSELLEEEILLVCRRGETEAARRAHPGLTTYVLPEMEMLHRFGPETIQKLHRLKKALNGWIVRPKESQS